MRIPLTRHGIRELLVCGGLFLLLAAGGWMLHPLAAVVPLLLFLFVVSFFRDPARRPSGGAETAVAPADGKVTDIEEVEYPDESGGRALRIGIFLSVFDVHVNRAPLDGRILQVIYRSGRFLDARHPDAGKLNEANLVLCEGPRGPFAVRQVAGLIARRIVFPFQAQDRLVRGQRMGMIKFGSRTELYVPAGAPVELLVEQGDKVKGGETALLRFRGR